MPDVHPCRRCGACCSAFRVSFYWGEADDAYGLVPAGLTVQVGRHLRAMVGTDRSPPRCGALLGDVGEAVACSIYENRSSTCRAFHPAWEDGIPNPECDRARTRHGLEPLTPETWRRRKPAA
ncbi:MAG: YkgJ family cysteine cluster protein [Alphaproteobacteria bacterium]|nr:YkgJ family cysteine cluster protein [Alphaproteobacteria bacterium]MCB9692983.1 YkgJ family cysteine cluster protein [Alphaproteobacteria bacterium]